MNNYPPDVISSIIRKSIYQAYYENTNNHQPSIHIDKPKPTGYRSIPFVETLSQPIARKLRSCTDIGIAYKSSEPLRSLFTKTKDKMKRLQKPNSVYEITCECGEKYIGHSARRLGERCKEHQYYIRSNSPKSALAKHSLDNMHQFSFAENNVRILTTESNKQKREFKEACLIFQNREQTVNLRTDTRIINRNYFSLLSPRKIPRN